MSASGAAELAEYEYQLEQISGALKADPENDELLTLKTELNDLIAITKASIQSSTSVSDGHAAIATSGESDKKRKLEPSALRQVGDQVSAKWITGDHQFYPAKITSITGSQADPVYTVKFLEYNEIQTLHSHQIRGINQHKKRTVDAPKRAPTNGPTSPTSLQTPETSLQPPPPPPSSTGSTAKGPPGQAAKKKPSMKENLAQSATSWNSFAKSGPKTTKKVGRQKAIGEGSMFRTEEGGRVGVIGSGRAMTSDPGKRGRHIFETD